MMLHVVDTIKPLAFLTRAATQGKNYTKLVVWLLHWAFAGRARMLVASLGLSGLYLAFQAGGIYAIYWYARQLETGHTVRVPHFGFELAARNEPQLLWAVVIVTSICFIASASFHFLSRRLIFGVVEQRYAKSLDEVAREAARLPDSRARVASRLLMYSGLGGVTAGCRGGVLTTIIFCNAISGTLGGIGAALFLFHIDTPLTLIILLATFVGALFLYPLVLRAARFSKDREKTQSAFQREAHYTNAAFQIEDVAELKTPARLSGAHLGVLRVNTEIIYAIEIGKTLILSAVIYYMASEMMAGRQNWAILIAYIGALRLVLMACSQAIRAYASVSRFYPQISRYHLFVKDVKHLDSTKLAHIAPGDRIVLGELVSGDEVHVKAGEWLATVTGDPVRELQFAMLHARVIGSDAPLGMSILTPNHQSIDAALVFADATQLAKLDEQALGTLRRDLRTMVVLVIHRDVGRVGAFGEKRVLVVEDGEFRRLATVGTREVNLILEETSLRARARKEQSEFDDEMVDEEDDI
jgi:hypothetical protein